MRKTASDPDKEFIDLKENMEFDLGGVHVEVHEMPGHTKGSVIFLIREPGILILGNACNNATFLFDQDASTVSEYLKELLDIRKLLDGKFLRDVLSGRADDLPFTFMGKQAWIAKKCNERFERADGKSGNLIYSREKL